MNKETNNKLSNEGKLEKHMGKGFGVAGLLACLIISYSSIINYHGSLNHAYDSLMNQSEKWPSKMFNINY